MKALRPMVLIKMKYRNPLRSYPSGACFGYHLLSDHL